MGTDFYLSFDYFFHTLLLKSLVILLVSFQVPDFNLGHVTQFRFSQEIVLLTSWSLLLLVFRKMKYNCAQVTWKAVALSP